MPYPVYTVYSGDVLPIFFDSFDGGTGASVTLTGLAVTDIEIYKDGSATQRASDAGYTLLDTDGIDFDGITGIHGFSIDTGDNTDAGFFAVGSWFHVVVSSVTIDGQTVNFVAAAFRIVAAEANAGVPVVDIKAISGDTTAADNLEAACDGGSYNVGGGSIVAASVTIKTGYELAADQAVNVTKWLGQAALAVVNGSPVVTLGAAQAAYAPAKAGDAMTLAAAYDAAKTAAQAGNAMTLADDAITASKYDESTAFPVKSADVGSTALARTGADSDTLETLSDQIDGASIYDPATDGVILAAVQSLYAPAKAGDSMAVADKTGFSLSADGILAIWHQALAGIVAASTVGKLIKDYLDAAISTRSVYAGGAVASVSSGVTLQADQAVNVTKWNGESVVTPAVSGSPVVTLGATQAAYAPAKATDIPSAANVADAVLDEALGAHAGFITTLLTAAGYTAPPSASAVATAVWGAGTRTLTSFGTLAADVWAAATRSLTDKAGFSLSTAGILAIWHQLLADIVTASTIGKLIKDNLDAKVSEVGGGSITPQIIRDSMMLAPTAGDPAAGSVDEHLDDIQANVEAISGGEGLTKKTYTLTDASTGLPLVGVQVWATTDEAGEHQVDITRTTNDAGQVTFRLNMDAGTPIYIWHRYMADGDAPDEEEV